MHNLVMAENYKKKVYVAMSGGVDSSVAAFLLKHAGYNVHGVYMKEWVPPGIKCEAGSDRIMAARVAAHFDISFEVWDFRKEYKKQVADYMLREYKAGRTPNPDVMCNKHIKFGVFLEKALLRGADYIATGHYVIKHEACSMKHRKNVSSFMFQVSRDNNKDQSYFLWTLTQKELAHCLFPIGDYTKSEVRAIAKKAGLPSWDKKDSQGVCFVGKLDFADFLRKYLPQKKGKIVTAKGEVIGEHDGVWFYTLGQRHGLTRIMNHKSRVMNKKGNAQPYYVVDKDVKKNVLIVAEEAAPELYKKELAATNINWISGNPSVGGAKFPLKCKARIRYRQSLQECKIESESLNLELGKKHTRKILNSKFHILFKKPQRAITPGQSIVFYKGKEMVGGGIIQ